MKEWFHILELLVSVVNNAPVVMFGMDMRGICTLARGRGLQDFGLTPDEIVGCSIMEMYADRPVIVGLLERSLGGETVRGDFFLADKFYEIILSPAFTNDGEVQIGVSGVLVDITERKQFEQALVTMSSTMELFNKEKSELMNIVAHDLRSPLTNILLAAEQLLLGLESREKERFTTELIIENCSHLFDLTKNLLDSNALEMGKINLTPTNFNISEIAGYVVDIYTRRAGAKNISLNYVCQSDTLMAFANENATRQVLDNLISNAIKYSPQGKTVSVNLTRCTSRETQRDKLTDRYIRFVPPDMPALGTCVRIEIRDEGPGFSDSDKEFLFHKFTKLSARPTANETSVGLGLSIVKKLVEGMDGHVWCESEQGQGAVFIVELPFFTETEYLSPQRVAEGKKNL